MTKVYLATGGIYSDYGVYAAFDSKNLAQKFLEIYHAQQLLNGEAMVEEYDVNPHEVEINAGLKRFRVQLKKNGDLRSIELLFNSFGESDGVIQSGWKDLKIDLYQAYIFAKSEEHAIKIANEQRSQIIAMNKWPEWKEGRNDT